MLSQSSAHIFLAERRAEFRSEGFRSFQMRELDSLGHADSKSVSIFAVKDETLEAEATFTFEVQEQNRTVLIPLIGGLEVKWEGKEPEYVRAGEALCLDPGFEKQCSITNPYPDHAVNYLRLCFHSNEISGKEVVLSEFDLANKNVLLPVFTNAGREDIFIGKYDGRAEDIFVGNTSDQPIFTFVVEGAFEVQNRLLESRDALLVWDTKELEFEALSEEAIILVVGLRVDTAQKVKSRI